MTGDQLRALQAPLKAKYKESPAEAKYAISISGVVEGDEIACQVQSPRGTIVAGLHPATGGDGSLACSADLLLEALVACAGVTLKAVATAMGIPLTKAVVTATGDLDFRGTLGVSKEVPVGLSAVKLSFDLQSSSPREQLDKLIELTERYCVIYQTLAKPPHLSKTIQVSE